MVNEVTVESRYLKYNKAEVEELLDSVKNTTLATEEGVRSIVRDWEKDEPEPEPEVESEG